MNLLVQPCAGTYDCKFPIHVQTQNGQITVVTFINLVKSWSVYLINRYWLEVIHGIVN